MTKGLEPTRRKVVGGALTLPFVLSAPNDGLATTLKRETVLAERIAFLQKECGVGGTYYRAFHSPTLVEKTLEQLAPQLFEVMMTFRVLHQFPDAAYVDDKKYLALTGIPGLSSRTIPTNAIIKLPNGTAVRAESFCNFFKFHALTVSYESTAAHCVKDTAIETEYFHDVRIGDVALKRIDPNTSGTMLTLPHATDNELVSGLLGTTLGTKNNHFDAFYGPLIKMTAATYAYMIGDEKVPEPLATHVRNGFWKIIPPEQGQVETIVNGHKQLAAQGRSGSIEVVYVVDSNKRVPRISGGF